MTGKIGSGCDDGRRGGGGVVIMVVIDGTGVTGRKEFVSLCVKSVRVSLFANE